MESKLPELIRRERTRQGLSQRTLAKAIGMSPPIISWAETGKEPISRSAMTKIVSTLGLNPEDYPELQPDSEATPRAARRKPRKAHSKSPAPTVPANRDDEVGRVTRMLERDLRIWSRMSAVRQIHADTWRIPPDTKLPEEICRDATRGGEYTQQPTEAEGALIELRNGLVLFRITKTGPGHCAMHLIPADLHGPRAAPAWTYQSTRPTRAEDILQYHPVRDDAYETSVNPGTYRIEAEADVDWNFRWIQTEPGTGWVNIIEEEPRQDPGWSKPGLYASGPTAPTWTQLKVKVRQAAKEPMEVEAYALDGSGTVSIIKGLVGPEIVTMDAPFDPNKEYIISIHARSEWDLYFVRADDEL